MHQLHLITSVRWPETLGATIGNARRLELFQTLVALHLASLFSKQQGYDKKFYLSCHHGWCFCFGVAMVRQFLISHTEGLLYPIGDLFCPIRNSVDRLEWTGVRVKQMVPREDTSILKRPECFDPGLKRIIVPVPAKLSSLRDR